MSIWDCLKGQENKATIGDTLTTICERLNAMEKVQSEIAKTLVAGLHKTLTGIESGFDATPKIQDSVGKIQTNIEEITLKVTPLLPQLSESIKHLEEKYSTLLNTFEKLKKEQDSALFSIRESLSSHISSLTLIPGKIEKNYINLREEMKDCFSRLANDIKQDRERHDMKLNLIIEKVGKLESQVKLVSQNIANINKIQDKPAGSEPEINPTSDKEPRILESQEKLDESIEKINQNIERLETWIIESKSSQINSVEELGSRISALSREFNDYFNKDTIEKEIDYISKTLFNATHMIESTQKSIQEDFKSLEEKVNLKLEHVISDFCKVSNSKKDISSPEIEVLKILSILDALDGSIESGEDTLNREPTFWKRILNSDTDFISSWLNGFKLMRGRLLSILADHEIHPIETFGCTFDPNYHKVIGTEEGVDNNIIKEITKGYRVGDRVIRHAEVILGKEKKLSL